MISKRVISAAALFACCGSAFAQVDGKITNAGEAALYGAPKWVQNVTTGFGDSGPSNPCDSNGTGGDPAAVTTGLEFKFPLASLGLTGTSTVKILAFVNGQGHDYASNQFLPGLPANSGNLGGDGTGAFTGNVGGINLANFAGDQFATIDLSTLTAATPAIDGTKDAAYGTAVALQTNRTRFGNSNTGTQAASGSELDGMYVAVDAEFLYIMITGNMQSNFNKFELFIDSEAGGQNPISSSLPDIDFGALGKFVGFAFDAGFSPDHYITFGAGNDPVQFYPNYANLNTFAGSFIGCNTAGNGSGLLNGCGEPAFPFEIALDNVNIGGVDATCPPPAGSADVASGSEIDAVYSYVSGGRLFVLVTGNLENDNGSGGQDAGGNKLNLFLDGSVNEGQNQLLTNEIGNPRVVDISYGNLARMGGMTFDAGFSADYWMSIKTGGEPVYQVMDAAVLRTDGMRKNFVGSALDYGAYDGGLKNTYNPVSFNGNSVYNGNPSDPQPQDGFSAFLFTNFAPRAAAESLALDNAAPVGTPGLVTFSIDNSNFGGVQGTGGSVSDAANVTTGVEFSIDLTELGFDGTSCIKLAGFISGGTAEYGSNQVIGGLPGQDYPNLGNAGNLNTIDFNTIEGTQWVIVAAGEGCETGPVCAPCAADYDQDGGVTGSDVEAFFIDFEAGTGCADVDLDGGITGADVEAFFIAFENGGC